VITPNAAAGVFQRGDGTRLGSWWEFRTGAEIAYQFADTSRLGLATISRLFRSPNPTWAWPQSSVT
jgi:hypothetical protein